MPDAKKTTKIEEGILKKGGKNNMPKIPRPATSPPAQAVQQPAPPPTPTPPSNQNAND